MVKPKYCRKCNKQLTRIEKMEDGKVREFWLIPHRVSGQNYQCKNSCK